ncbi:hypothetical protein REPUB_Repub01dG0113200 [Reevesia pubescens]
MYSNASGFLLNNTTSTLHSVYYQAKEDNGIIDLGPSLRTSQPEAYHPSIHRTLLSQWLAPEECDDEAEGVQSRERRAYVKVNMDGVMKLLVLTLLRLLFASRRGWHTSSGLRLFEVESEFSMFYKDTEDNWSVGDVPWKEFVVSVKRLRISPKNEARYPCSPSFN